jgi:hypothetical protein
MKKFITLASAVILIFGLAATTYAIDWSASGFVRVRSAWYVNADNPNATQTKTTVWDLVDDVVFDDPDPGDIRVKFKDFDVKTKVLNEAYDDTNAWMDTRFRLRFSAKHEDLAEGVIYFEGDSSRWGEEPDGRNKAGAWNADRNAVELKQFYIDFKVPGLSDFAPTSVRAGIQGFALRSHFLLFADGAGVELNTTTGPVKWSWYWYKPEEGADNQADDADFYGVRLWLPGLLPVTPGGYFLYLNAGDYPLRDSTAAGPYDKGAFWWAGFYLDGKVGPVALKSDFAYFNGEKTLSGFAANEALANGDIPPPDPDFSGYGLFVDASVSDIVPNVTFGGAFAYGSGDDLVDTVDQLSGEDDEFDGFRVPPGSEEPYIGNWGMVYYASAINDGVRISNLASGTEAALGKLGGSWFGKLYASYKFPAWLTTTIYGMYIGDTTDEGNTQGDARDIIPKIAGLSSGFEDDSDIGIELGAYCNISIYKNLTYSIGGGYLFAGGALDTYTGSYLEGATGDIVFGTPGLGDLAFNESPRDPWAILSQLIFKF